MPNSSVVCIAPHFVSSCSGWLCGKGLQIAEIDDGVRVVHREVAIDGGVVGGWGVIGGTGVFSHAAGRAAVELNAVTLIN